MTLKKLLVKSILIDDEMAELDKVVGRIVKEAKKKLFGFRKSTEKLEQRKIELEEMIRLGESKETFECELEEVEKRKPQT